MSELENQDKAIVDNDELLNKKTQSVPRPREQKDIDTEKQWINNISNAAINGSLDLSAINSFTNSAQTREQIYSIIDMMCEDSTIAAILETYAEDATEYNDQGDIV